MAEDLDINLPELVDTGSDPLSPAIALDYFRGKVPVTIDEWDKLKAQNHDWAFKLAGIADIDVVEQVYAELETAIANGTDFREFKAKVFDSLDNAWAGSVKNPGWRIETIFRTNVQSSYQAGHRAQAVENQADRPYGVLDVVQDDRTSDICIALDEKLQGRAIPLSDPIWTQIWPPNHFNCRDTVITMTEEEAIAQGLLDNPPKVQVDDEFAHPPGQGGEPDPEDYPSDLRGDVERFTK